MDKEERLKDLAARIDEDNISLKKIATNLVLGKGNSDADILFIGEAPGHNEDIEGKPFVGQAGKQLNGLLNLINLELSDVYIANILKYRPPENRNPKMGEIREHVPYLLEQIDIIKPKVVVTLGNFATKFALNGFEPDGMNSVPGISKLHGKSKEVEYNNHRIIVFPMYHPAAMLYNPGLRKVIEKDFKKLKKIISR